MQINNNLVLRIKNLLGMQKEGKIINDRICGVNDILKGSPKYLLIINKNMDDFHLL
jgi:hypothetical protein